MAAHVSSEVGESSDDESFLFRCEDGLFEATDDADAETKEHSLRLQRRQRCAKLVDAAARAGGSRGCSVLELKSQYNNLRWIPIPGNQQGVAWECSLRLCRILEKRGTRYRRVVELGCGLGLPGMTAARLGAERVVVTDSSMAALAPAAAAISLNGLNGTVSALPLHWGTSHEDEVHAVLDCFAPPAAFPTRALHHAGESGSGQDGEGGSRGGGGHTGTRVEERGGGGDDGDVGVAVDLVLCSDLIYGDEVPSRLLVETLLQICGPSTLVLSLHERRIHGDQGASFFKALHDSGAFLVRKDLPLPEAAFFTSALSTPRALSAPPEEDETHDTGVAAVGCPNARISSMENNDKTKEAHEGIEDDFFCLCEIRRK
mmetsp:Transcript_13468/g.26589  ORF Transcript_13468/g.26589 Transcript_13468/m.26589 type:complete len:373 (+) Transcript_13468:75-1193(+)